MNFCNQLETFDSLGKKNIPDNFIDLNSYGFVNSKGIKMLFFDVTEEEILKYVLLLANPKIRKILDLIAILEGTKNYEDKFTKTIDYSNSNMLPEYKVLIGYSTIDPLVNEMAATNLDGLYDHPKTVFQVNNLYSSAAGRYQFIKDTWTKCLKAFNKMILRMNLDSEYKKKIENVIDKLFSEVYSDDIRNFYNYTKENKNYNEVINVRKFGPFWQDLAALILIEKDVAKNKDNNLDKILKIKNMSDLMEILYILSPVWASFKSSSSTGSYYSGQSARPQKFIDDVVQKLNFFNLIDRRSGKKIRSLRKGKSSKNRKIRF